MNNRLKATILAELLESSSSDDDDDEMLFSSSSSSQSDSDSETDEDDAIEIGSAPESKDQSQLSSTKNKLMNIIDGYNDEEFKSHFKMERSTVEFLVENYSSSLFMGVKLHGGKARMGARKEVYLYIFFITNLITFTNLAVLFSVSKSSSWLAVGRVAKWLIRIGHKYVQWPSGTAFKENQQKFETDKTIPGVIGAIGCSHIEIRAPKNRNKSSYKRGKAYNVTLQAVADADRKFIDIYCGEPGSFNENVVLNESELFQRTKDKYTELFPDNSYILGGSVYSPQKWLVPLYKDDALSDSQGSFNLLLSETIAVIEEAFALLKSRFRKLTDLQDQTNVPAITILVVSACVLHNICILRNDVYCGEIVDEVTNDWQPKKPFGDVIVSDGSRRRALFNYLLERNVI